MVHELNLRFYHSNEIKEIRPVIKRFIETHVPCKNNVLFIFVALNEAINNANLYRSKATGVEVKLRATARRFLARVKNDGEGFDAHEKLRLIRHSSGQAYNLGDCVEGGRGLILIESVSDVLIFNEKGNELLFTRKIYKD